MLKYMNPFHGRDFGHGRVRARIENPGQTDLSAQGVLSYDVILRGFSIQDQPPDPQRQSAGYRPLPCTCHKPCER